MNKKKRSAALLLSMCMALNLGNSAFAAGIDEKSDSPSQQKPETSGIVLQELDKVDESELHNLVNLPEANTYSPSSEEVTYEPLSSINVQFPNKESLRNVKNLKEVDNLVTSYFEKSAPQYELQTFSDLLPAGTDSKAYSLELNPNDMVQFSLEVPHNAALDYDLFLFDIANGADQAQQIDYCAYTTSNLFMPETISYINTGSTVQNLAIQVQAKGQTSDTDYFTMNVCWDKKTDIDILEPDNSPFAASVCPPLNAEHSLKFSERISCPIDEDWLAIPINDMRGFAGLTISGLPDNLIVESYIAVSNFEVSRTGSTSNGGTLPVQKGTNYLRILKKPNATFTPTTYTLTVSPALKPNQVDVIISVDGYCQRSSSEFADGLHRYLYLMGANVVVTAKYYRNGIPVMADDDKITVMLDDPSWDNPEVRYSQNTGYSNSGVHIDLPPIRGDRYDLVYTTITSNKFGVIKNNDEMANVTKYNGGELTMPCRHNGDCGLK